MKTFLSFGAFLLATPAMTLSAAAGCVPVPGYDVCRPPAAVGYVAKQPQPRRREAKARLCSTSPSTYDRNNARKRRTVPRPGSTPPSDHNRRNARKSGNPEKRHLQQALRPHCPRGD
jgi:hypothetical protein